MTCPLRRMGEMKAGHTTVVLTRGDATVVFKQVPAMVCDDCGDYFFDEKTTIDVYQRAEQAFTTGQEVAISKFAVA